MEYRRAEKKDIEQLTAFRMEFVQLIRTINNADSFHEKTKEYFDEHMDRKDLSVFIAVESGKIVSSCMACIFRLAPLPSCPNGKVAEILNVYTLAEYQKKGIGEVLLRMLLEDLKEKGVGKAILEHTDAGYPLYKKVGFEEIDHQMKISLC